MAEKGGLATIFDLSFTEFVTTRVIKVLYVIGILFSGLFALAIIIGGFSEGAAKGILGLIIGPIVFLVYVLLARIWCEMIIVVFRIADNTSKIVAGTEKIAESTGSLSDQLKF